jgi:SAM-dependent methyltransferase
MVNEKCHLCGSDDQELKYTKLKGRDFIKCPKCSLIYVTAKNFPTRDEERLRYDKHHNEESNLGYIEFLNQIVEITKPYLNLDMKGLDYGCGPNPVLASLLNDEAYQCGFYDPYYFPHIPDKKFDFIFSTECFEHFFSPGKEIDNICSLLNQNGILAIMTDVWNDELDFENWYYIRDLTHVSFFHLKTMQFLNNKYHLELIETDQKRCFVFRKKG